MRVWIFLALIVFGLWLYGGAVAEKSLSLQQLHRITSHAPTMGWPPA